MITHSLRLVGIFTVVVLSNCALDAAEPPTKDAFGVLKLAPTAKRGREWFAEWKTARSVGPYKQDAKDALFKNAEGTLAIKGGVATAPPGRTRFFVLTPKTKPGTTARRSGRTSR